MPACFQLTRKGESEPARLNQIDREICEFLEIEEHPTKYAYGWFDFIGFLLATGLTFDLIEANIVGIVSKGEGCEYDDIMLKINDFLRKNFVSDAWHEVGRR